MVRLAKAPPSIRSPPLKLTTAQLEAIRAQLESGARAGAEVLVPEAALCLLADFPNGALVGHGDITAGVVVRFQGAFGGTAVFALDPEDALAWMRPASARDDLIPAYLDRVAGLVASAVNAWGESMGVAFAFGEPVLHEDSVVGILLGTHAPSDTLILSARLAIDADGAPRPAHLYLMVDPKVLEVWAGHTA
ncbi:MAG: hypothetical protein ACQGVK_17225 [Myxococcota bacterium]